MFLYNLNYMYPYFYNSEAGGGLSMLMASDKQYTQKTEMFILSCAFYSLQRKIIENHLVVDKNNSTPMKNPLQCMLKSWHNPKTAN